MTGQKRAVAMLAGVIFLFLSLATQLFALQVGDKAPDFELESTKGGKLKLSDLRGKNVLINFYRNDFDPT